MTVPIRTHPVASKRRRSNGASRRVPWKTLGIVCTGFVLAAVAWAVGWSPLFALTDVAVTGLRTLQADDIRAAIGNKRTLPMTDLADIEDTIMRDITAVASVSVTRDWPHGLVVAVTERVPYGVWCRSDDCRLFDRSGVRWGSALPSRGTLLLSVRDERPQRDVPKTLFEGMVRAAEGLPAYGIRALLVTLPDQAPGDVVVTTDTGYDLVLDGFGDIAEQLDTLSILLAEHAADTTFKPTRIDLRTPGRIFYR